MDSVAKKSNAAVACVTWHCKCDFESKSAWIVANEFTQFPFRFSSKINLPQWQITCLYNLVELTSQAGHRDLPEIEGMCDKSKFTFPDCSIWKNLSHCGARLRKRPCCWRQAPSVACLIDYSSTKVNSSAPGKNKDTPKHIQGALCRTCTLCSVHTRTCQIGKKRNFESKHILLLYIFCCGRPTLPRCNQACLPTGVLNKSGLQTLYGEHLKKEINTGVKPVLRHKFYRPLSSKAPPTCLEDYLLSPSRHRILSLLRGSHS